MATRVRKHRRQLSCRRQGLSFLEFIGCLIAVVGGMWLGAIYMGVDVQGLAFNALHEADLLQHVPEELRPVAPPDHPSQMSQEQRASVLQAELATLRDEITALRQTRSKDSPSTQSGTTANQPSAEITRAYWNRLRGIAHDEAALQAGAQMAASEANADRVFALRSRSRRTRAQFDKAVSRRAGRGRHRPFTGVDGRAVTEGRAET